MWKETIFGLVRVTVLWKETFYGLEKVTVVLKENVFEAVMFNLCDSLDKIRDTAIYRGHGELVVHSSC